MLCCVFGVIVPGGSKNRSVLFFIFKNKKRGRFLFGLIGHTRNLVISYINITCVDSSGSLAK